MANTDFTTTATPGASSGGWSSGIITRFNRVSFVPTNAEVHNIFDVIKGEKVMAVAMKVITGSNAATTISIGDGDNAAGYLAATNVGSANNGVTTVGTTGVYLNGAHASADRQPALSAATDTIDITVATSGTNTITLEFELVSIRTTLA